MNPYEPGLIDKPEGDLDPGVRSALILSSLWAGAKLGVKWSALVVGTIWIIALLGFLFSSLS